MRFSFDFIVRSWADLAMATEDIANVETNAQFQPLTVYRDDLSSREAIARQPKEVPLHQTSQLP
jgi:hypothetical protein